MSAITQLLPKLLQDSLADLRQLGCRQIAFAALFLEIFDTATRVKADGHNVRLAGEGICGLRQMNAEIGMIF
jgi:hypothetical protein